MFCMKCGAPLEEDSLFCSACGQRIIEEEALENTSVAEESTVVTEEVPVNVGDNAFVEEPVMGTNADVQTQFAVPDFEEKKTPRFSKKSLIFGAIGVAAVALIAVVIFNFKTIYGGFIKLFGSDQAYFKYVEAQQLKGFSDSITDYYEQLVVNSAKMDQSATTTLKLNVSKDAAEMLGELSGYDEDLSWLNGIELEMDSNIYKNMQSVGLSLNISNKDILSLNTIIDSITGETYVSIPELSDSTLYTETKISGAPVSGVAIMNASGEDMYKALEILEKALPSEKELNQLLAKYIGVALDKVDDVSMSKETVSAGGLSKKYTVLEVTITDETVYEMLEAVLTELKNDKKVKSMIQSLEKEVDKADLSQGEDLDLYAKLIDAIDSGLDDIEDMKGYTNGDEIAVLEVYVNGKHEIVGHKLEVDDEVVLDYVTVQKGRKFATDFEAGEIKITGEGKNSGNKQSGTYNVKVNDMKLLELSVEKFDTKKIKEGYIDGTFTIEPSKELFRQYGLGSMASTALSVADPAIEIKCDTSKNDASFEINILNKEEVLLGVEIDSKSSGGKKIQKPTKNLVDVEDSDEVEEFFESLDFEEIMKQLKKTDIPTEILDAIEEGIDMLEDLPNLGGMGSVGNFDDYGNYGDYGSYYDYY